MRKCASYILYTLLLATVACACSDNIDIKRDYEFTVTHLPVPKKLKTGEVAEIRCRLIRSGHYDGAKYSLRYYQTEGKGQLWMDGREPFLPNDLYDLPEDTFRLYFRSMSDDQHALEITFLDNFNNEFVLPFSFGNDRMNEGQ
jgi:hypothetical protein